MPSNLRLLENLRLCGNLRELILVGRLTLNDCGRHYVTFTDGCLKINGGKSIGMGEILVERTLLPKL